MAALSPPQMYESAQAEQAMPRRRVSAITKHTDIGASGVARDHVREEASAAMLISRSGRRRNHVAIPDADSYPALVVKLPQNNDVNMKPRIK